MWQDEPSGQPNHTVPKPVNSGDVAMKLERVFQVEKETKNTIRYSEVAEGQPPVIGTIYVQKWAMKGIPKKVKVTVEAEEG